MKIFFAFCLLPFAFSSARAAGTYYTGGYQTPQGYAQQGYAPRGYAQQGYAQRGYAPQQQGSYANSAYSRYQPMTQQQAPQNQQQSQSQSTSPQGQKSAAKQGFYFNGSIARETAEWNFQLQKSNSILHYDNIAWNVFDLNGGYVFGAGNTSMQIDAGIKFGLQGGDSYMIDDDITNGGYFITRWIDSKSGATIGDETGHVLSIGTSNGGSMFGFNVGLGLTDFFSMGAAKITPSIGYRNLSYKLSTKNNYGLSVDAAACLVVNGSDEVQCDPAIVVLYGGTRQIIWRDSLDAKMSVDANATEIDAGETYYYKQPGTSHSYEVAWAGPYLALDVIYDMNANNSMDARIELGLPGYEAVGDQPYRFDWAHPKSVEDVAGIASALHFGFSSDWRTALSDSIMMSIGLTYDYYTVSGVDAKTYLNKSFYTGIYDGLLANWKNAGKSEEDMLNNLTGDPLAINIKNLESECPGWVCTASSEINSFYKSVGIRVGFNAKF